MSYVLSRLMIRSRKCLGDVGTGIFLKGKPMINTLWDQAQAHCYMGTKALIKTNKSAAKRIKLRGSGNVKRSKGGTSHNTGYKSRQASNKLGQSTGIKEAKIEKRMRRLIYNK